MILPVVLLLAMAFFQWIRFFQVQEESMRALNEQVRTLSQYGYLTEEMAGLMTGEENAFRDNDLLDEVVLTDIQTLEFPVGFVKVERHFLRQAGLRLFTGRYFAGTDGDSAGSGDGDDTLVYLAETGTVYHTRAECTHLKLSISRTVYGALSELRNQNGAIYHACEVCVKSTKSEAEDRVYITEEGNRYHIRIDCRGLLRRVRTGTLQEALSQGRRLCSRCAAAGEGKETGYIDGDRICADDHYDMAADLGDRRRAA